MRRVFAFQQKVETSSSGYNLLGTSRINSCSNDDTTNDLGVVEGSATFGNTWTEEEKRIQREISSYLGLQDVSVERGLTPIKHIHQLDTWDCGEAVLVIRLRQLMILSHVLISFFIFMKG